MWGGNKDTDQAPEARLLVNAEMADSMRAVETRIRDDVRKWIEQRLCNIETHMQALMNERGLQLVRVREETLALNSLLDAVIAERLELRKRMPTRRNATGLTDRCTARRDGSKNRCTLVIGHPGPHLSPLDEEYK